ncbi:LysE family translocator [Inhella sp.]|uniref:LysE family translocator n=1 Tax=Inhella sp. TaxID=1921806 RepID=UPI0035B3CFAD
MLSALISVALLHWLVLVTPGANFLLVGQLAASGQRRAAVLACLGITCVTFTWALLAVLGVGAVFALHPLLRQGAQVAGGLYLLWVAWRLLRSGAAAAAALGAAAQLRGVQAFRLGFLTNILNPKTALFFSSAFAALLPPGGGWGLSAAAVLLVYLNALVWHLFLALAFGNPHVQRVYAARRRALNRLCGSLVGVFGLRLLAPALLELRAR